jgi:hypothetical protein
MDTFFFKYFIYYYFDFFGTKLSPGLKKLLQESRAGVTCPTRRWLPTPWSSLPA